MAFDHGFNLAKIILDLIELDVTHSFEATTAVSLLEG